MKTVLTISLAAALLSLPASAQIWIMSPTGGSPPTGAGSSSHAPPPTCAGVIDLSTGCTLPMLGVL